MEQQKSLHEVVNTEKQMLSLIYSKGILHEDVLELYRRIRSVYEKNLLNSNQTVEHQEVEFHLWKLHYELIDEFRKKIKKQSFNSEYTEKSNIKSNNDKGLEGFKSFLSEAIEFYKSLIANLRKCCGLPSEIFLDNKDHSPSSLEPTKLHVCRHTCHRLLVCLGDLARYTEIVKKPDASEWSTAAMYYLEAARTCPDSGNPHNQLALLATYVGDAFLALYHCVRSLAVKEPFPDAWRNIMLLFEENRSTKLPSLSSQTQFDFLNPSKRSYNMQNTNREENSSQDNCKQENLDNFSTEKFDLWPILVRTISILLIRSSLEDFPSTLASALHSLEAMLAVDDTQLAVTLASYQHMDSSRRGPYRAIQLVSIFIFIAHSLTEGPQQDESTGEDRDQKQHAELAFAAIFIFMGRITERCCLRGDETKSCPLLPGVLVFSEWLVGALDMIKGYDTDPRVKNALSYYFAALANLSNRIEQNQDKTALIYHTALWEDHELRGLHPLLRVHETLDFTTYPDCMHDYRSRNQCRVQRMIHAARKITDMSKSKPLSKEIESNSCLKSQPTPDEEEVILFKPITRRNSAPLYISKPNKEDPVCSEGGPQVQKTLADHLRRATSLSSTGQNTEDNDSFSFCSTASNSGHNRPFKQNEIKDSITHHAGPPSLSAWVPRSNEHGTSDFNKQKLSPIDETSSTSFSDLSINKTKDANVATGDISTIVHKPATPTPSAPLLPDDAVWLRSNSLISPEYKGVLGNDSADGILGAPPISGYTGWSAVRPPIGYVDGYPPSPPLGMMSSSEWLYHYRNGQNMLHFNAPAIGNYHPNELSSFDLCDQWGNHLVSNPMLYLGSAPQYYPSSSSSLVYGAEEPKRDKYFLGYQRPFPYVCGVGMELSSEQPSLLQYLKEKERQLQPGSQLRGPPFMGS